MYQGWHDGPMDQWILVKCSLDLLVYLKFTMDLICPLSDPFILLAVWGCDARDHQMTNGLLDPLMVYWKFPNMVILLYKWTTKWLIYWSIDGPFDPLINFFFIKIIFIFIIHSHYIYITGNISNIKSGASRPAGNKSVKVHLALLFSAGCDSSNGAFCYFMQYTFVYVWSIFIS